MMEKLQMLIDWYGEDIVALELGVSKAALRKALEGEEVEAVQRGLRELDKAVMEELLNHREEGETLRGFYERLELPYSFSSFEKWLYGSRLIPVEVFEDFVDGKAKMAVLRMELKKLLADKRLSLSEFLEKADLQEHANEIKKWLSKQGDIPNFLKEKIWNAIVSIETEPEVQINYITKAPVANSRGFVIDYRHLYKSRGKRSSSQMLALIFLDGKVLTVKAYETGGGKYELETRYIVVIDGTSYPIENAYLFIDQLIENYGLTVFKGS